MENNEKALNFEISPEVANGDYVNLAIIHHSHSEFVLDFSKLLPALPKAKVCHRLIMTPEHAKRLLFALNDNISKYEAQYGSIQVENQKQGATLNLNDFMNGNGSKS